MRVADRVFLLTGQWLTVPALEEELTPATTDLFVDLWSFDAATAKPLWRRRLETKRNGAMTGRKILGADGDTLWLLLPSGLTAVSTHDGSPQADSRKIEAINSQLADRIPHEDRYFEFDVQGLKMTSADGRIWRLQAGSFQATPDNAPPKARPGISVPAYYAPNSTYSFLEYKLNIAGGRWLGLLTDKEAAAAREKGAANITDPWESRRRLWGARGEKAKNFFGEYWKYKEYTPLGPEFLHAGLLQTRDEKTSRLLLEPNPDSVFVLHRDRLGEQGRLQLTRVAGPAGRVVWHAALPLSVLQCVMGGSKSVVLYGAEFRPPQDDRPRDPLHDAREMLVAVDLATGALGAHDVHRHIPPQGH